MGRKKLNFSTKDFKKSNAQEAGFKTKALAIKFLKSTPKKTFSNFTSVNELTDYIKNQKNKLKDLGIDVDFAYKQKSRLTKAENKNKKVSVELETKLKNIKVELNRPEEIESNTFIFKHEPNESDILNCANKFYQKNNISIPRDHDYKNFKNEKKKTFNFKYNDEPLELSNLLYHIFNKQKYRYKINISFAFTLIREVHEDFRYEVKFQFFDASTNTRILDHPEMIDNKKDIDLLVQKIQKMNLVEKLIKKREGSSWKFYEFIYVRFDVYEMDSPIGAGIELPQHLLTGSNQKYLIKYNEYDDKLCFWRCLAFCFDVNENPKKDPRKVKESVKRLFNEYYGGFEDIENYSGVRYVEYNEDYDDDNDDIKADEITKIEKNFKVNINVYNNDTSIINKEGEEDYIVEIERRSMTNYELTLNLMRYKNHFMYITNLDNIRHTFKCRNCGKFCKNMKAVKAHEPNCKTTTYILNGGFYNAQKNIFDEVFKKYKKSLNLTNKKKINYLEEFKLTENDLYYPFEIVYDFEARMKKIKVLDDSKQLKITNQHIPVSVSINSNVEGYDKAYFICNEQPEILIDEFIKYIHQIALKAEELNRIRYKKIIKFLERLNNHDEEDSLYSQFFRWMCEIPVLSFNGSKYDINLMKQYLHKSLKDIDETVSFAIKKSNSYMALKTPHFKFLDIRSYLAPNYSYEAFIKAYKCKLNKGYFPYDYLTDYDKLNETKLPPHGAFYNKLKNKNITDEEYKICVDAWNEHNMKTFKDFLEWYNNLDVIPFVEAVEKMKEFYKLKKLDIFKDGVSLPGLVLKYLMKSTESKFSLFEQEDEDLYKLMKTGIVGGPSIIFKRYVEAGKTFIRNGNKLCKKAIGYDANALYLWAISQDMPTGKYNRIESYDLKQLEHDILNDKVFGFLKVDIETPEHLKKYFEEMTPIFKNTVVNYEDMGTYMQEYHKQNNISFVKSKKLIGSYFGKEILLYTPILKWYIKHGLKITKFHVGIEYTAATCFKKFADEVSDARRAGDIDKAYELIAETMKLFGNSAYGKTITNKEGFVSTTYATEDNINKKINNPRFKDLEELYGQNYEVISSKKEIKLDLPLQIGCAVYQLAKLRMLEFYFDFIDKYIDRSDFELVEMDTDSNYFAFSEDSIEKLIKPEMREEYEKDKYNFLPSESNELHPTFEVDGKRFTMKQYEKRTPGLFKVECVKDKIIALCSKMYCCADMDEKALKFSCKGIQKDNNNITYKKFENVLFNKSNDIATNQGFRYINGFMKSYEQQKKGLSYIYNKRILLDDGINTIPLNI